MKQPKRKHRTNNTNKQRELMALVLAKNSWKIFYSMSSKIDRRSRIMLNLEIVACEKICLSCWMMPIAEWLPTSDGLMFSHFSGSRRFLFSGVRSNIILETSGRERHFDSIFFCKKSMQQIQGEIKRVLFVCQVIANAMSEA